jgi:cobalt-zinc-cadmium efflux system outer membrane protein
MVFNRTISLLILIYGVASLGGIARADRSQSLTLAQALALTLQKSPELDGVSWDIRAAEARILQAGLRPNPELMLESEDITGTGSYKRGDQMQNTLQLTQLVELGGKRQARVRISQSEQQLADWDYQIKRIEVLKQTTVAFIDVLTAQSRVDLAEEIVGLAQKVVSITQKQVEVGKISDIEVTRSSVAAAGARVDLEQAKQDLLVARGYLAAQWGAVVPDFTSVTGDLERIRPHPELETLMARLGRNPQLARWTTERERRRAVLASAQAEGRPDVRLGAGPRLIGKGDDVTLVATVSVPLPLFNRNQGRIAETQANLSKVANEQRAAETRAYAQLNEQYQTLVRASEQLRILERDVLPGANTAVTRILEGYNVGRYSQLDVLEARRTLNDARAQRLRVLAGYQKASTDIDALTASPIDLPCLNTNSKPGWHSQPINN